MRENGNADWTIVIGVALVMFYVIMATVFGVNQIFIGITGCIAALALVYFAYKRRVKELRDE